MYVAGNGESHLSVGLLICMRIINGGPLVFCTFWVGSNRTELFVFPLWCYERTLANGNSNHLYWSGYIGISKWICPVLLFALFLNYLSEIFKLAAKCVLTSQGLIDTCSSTRYPQTMHLPVGAHKFILIRYVTYQTYQNQISNTETTDNSGYFSVILK